MRAVVGKIILLFVFITGFFSAEAAVVRVGLAVDIKKCTFISAASSYHVTDLSGNELLTLIEGESIVITLSSKGFIISKGMVVIYSKKNLLLHSDYSESFFRLKSGETPYPYDGDLELKASARGFTAINIVPLEKYVAGVVESEAGDNINSEFLKVQSVLVRTFALAHAGRHDKQSFDVCDKVHCQVYHARSRFNKAILLAVAKTEGVILRDKNGKVITAAYHSNCGGQTVGSEDVWTQQIDYLKSVQDSFCVKAGHSNWEKVIDRTVWRKYLGSKFNCLIYDDIPDSLFSFNQPDRKNYLNFDGNLLALKTIRSDLKLNSTFFNIYPEGDKIRIKGKGYGHGVGLCQEGAMQMAEVGITMEEILKYYFNGATLGK